MKLAGEAILNILANPLVLLVIAIPFFLFAGIYFGVWLAQPRKKRVLKIQPESGMGEELEVDSEDTVNAYCKPISNMPPQRFIKRSHAYNMLRKGVFRLSNYALWFGRHGTAYTYYFGANSEPVKIPLRDAVKNIFGKELYDRIPNDEKTGYIKDQIEKSEVGVTVEFPNMPLTPTGLPSISSDDVRRNDIDTFISAIVRGVKSILKVEGHGEILRIIFILGTGIGIGIVLSLIFKWGSPIIIPKGA